MMAANNGRSRKRKIKNTSNGQSRKKKNKINEKSRSSWQTPPDDIMQCILQRLTIWDRIQVRMVCQSWRSVSMRKHIRSYPNEAPWLLMRSLKSPVFNNYDHIVFFSLSDRKTLKLTLPRAIREGWVYGSSKDWLIIAKGAYSTMFLLNPISGALSKLPCLSSVFSGFGALKELKGELDTQVMNDFCNRVVLSSSDIFAEQCMIGAIFRDRIVAVCRPGDKRWKKVLKFEQSEDAPKLCDIVFSSGILYVLVNYNDVDVASRATMFTGNEVEIRFVYDKDPPPIDTTLLWQRKSHLTKSITKNEVWLILRIKSKGETIRFIKYKLNGENNIFEVERLRNQVIFSSAFGCFLLASATFNEHRSCFEKNKKTGLYHLSSGIIQQIGSSSLTVSGHHGRCWFTPSFL